MFADIRRRRKHLKKCADLFKELDDIIDPVEEEQKMLMRMEHFGLERRESHGKGHCIYRSLSKYFFGTPVHYPVILKAIGCQLYAGERIYSRYMEGDFADYVNLVLSNKVWGDQVVVQAASDLFNIKIVVAVGEKFNCFYEFLPFVKPYKRVVYLCLTTIYMGDIYPFRATPPTTDVKKPVDSSQIHSVMKMNQSARLLEFCGNMFSYLEDQNDSTFHASRQQLRLDFFGCEKRDITGDGNCVYRTVSDQLWNDQEQHNLVRKSVRYQMDEKPSLYESQVHGDFLKYRENVSIDKVWGDYTTLKAVCDAFQVKFYVIVVDKDICIQEFCPAVAHYKKVLHATTAKFHMDSVYRVGETPMEADCCFDYLTLLEHDD